MESHDCRRSQYYPCSGMSWADNAATRFKIENGRIIVAQSYCGMCFDNATRPASAATVRGHAFGRANNARVP